MRSVVAAVLISACGAPAQNLYPAGSVNDDGHGMLAQASTRFMRHENATEEDLFATSRPPRDDDDEYGGSAYGGSAYGGAGYGAFVVPQWQFQPANRAPKYTQLPGLAGAIEGVVTWKGPIPAPRTTACGPLDLARVGPDRGIGDVIVFIERVQAGRTLAVGERPIAVGGVVVKRSCALVPTAQIVTPIPAALAVHGDGKPSRFKVTTTSGAQAIEVEAGGRATMQAQPGITRIDAADGSVASAWVLGLDTPYYAITDDHGRFRIDELAPGTYEVTIWRAPLPAGNALEYGEPRVVKRNVRVDGKQPAKLDITLDC